MNGPTDQAQPDAAEGASSHAEAASAWYAGEAVPAPQRPPLGIDLDVDVCVIGAGLAGLTAAREIARRGWSVAVLEADRIGGGASGRNTGFVLPGFGEDLAAIVARIGEPHARRLWALAQDGLDYVRRTIAETAMPGVAPVPGWLYVAKTSRAAELAAYAETLRAFGTEAEYWPVERVRRELPSTHYFEAVHHPQAFAINPLNYARGLARAAEDAGARLFENTPAVAIDPAGVRKRVTTPLAHLRASHVVLAGNVALGGLMPRLAATLIPITTYVIVTAPIPRLPEIIAYRGAVSDGDRADNHYRIVGGDRLMWCGRMTTTPRPPQRYARALARDITRVFPQLGAVSAEHVWNGTLGLPIHRMPQVGELRRGVWVASGFGGHGLNTTAMAGELLARGIVEGDETWRLFAPYELVWAGGALGRATMRGLALLRRPVEEAGQALARHRERTQARKAMRRAARQASRSPAVPPSEPVVAQAEPVVQPAAPPPVVSAPAPEAAGVDSSIAPAPPAAAAVASPPRRKTRKKAATSANKNRRRRES